MRHLCPSFHIVPILCVSSSYEDFSSEERDWLETLEFSEVRLLYPLRAFGKDRLDFILFLCIYISPLMIDDITVNTLRFIKF